MMAYIEMHSQNCGQLVSLTIDATTYAPADLLANHNLHAHKCGIGLLAESTSAGRQLRSNRALMATGARAQVRAAARTHVPLAATWLFLGREDISEQTASAAVKPLTEAAVGLIKFDGAEAIFSGKVLDAAGRELSKQAIKESVPVGTAAPQTHTMPPAAPSSAHAEVGHPTTAKIRPRPDLEAELAHVMNKEIKLPTDYNDAKLRVKFHEHKKDFGLGGSEFNKVNADKFLDAIRQHINDLYTQIIAGTHRGTQKVVHLYNPKTKINVMKGVNGDFISGWKLDARKERQVHWLETTGNVQ